MKTKTIPAISMLLGCLVSAICTYINGYKLIDSLKILLAVLIVFLIIGFVIKSIFDKHVPYIEKVEETGEQDEGSVIEKTGEEDVDGEMMESYAEEGEEAEDQYQF